LLLKVLLYWNKDIIQEGEDTLLRARKKTVFMILISLAISFPPLCLSDSGGAVKEDNGDHEIHFSRGIKHYESGNYKGAVEEFRRAVEINPALAEAYYNLGTSYSRLERYREAVKAYRQAAEIKPGRAEVHLGLGIAYLHLNDTSSSLQEYRILRDLDIQRADNLLDMIISNTSREGNLLMPND
jgi:Flp pilus assembly protein TadD